MLKKYIESFSKLISRQPPIGGLEVSQDSLRYSLISGNKIHSASLRLPPNLIGEKGVVDVSNFTKALEALKDQIEKNASVKGPINVVVSLPFSSTYLQTFKIPPVAEKDIKGAAELNMQMISPIPIAGAYYDFERIEGESSDGQIEFIGAFAPAIEVDSFVSPLKKAGFSVVAVEFSSFSLARVSNDLVDQGANKGTSLILHSGYRGLDFLVVRSGKLYFDYFVSWQALQIGQNGLTVQSLAPSLIRNLQQVINYSAGKFGEPVSNIYLSTPQSEQIFISAISNNLGVNVYNLTSNRFPQADPRWMVSIGLALRGLIPRSQDSLITLSRTDTQDDYRNNQIAAFIHFWRTVSVSVLSFILIVFFISDVFLTNAANSVAVNRGNSSSSINAVREEVIILEEDAQSFNRLVESVQAAERLRFSWRPFLFEIIKTAGNDVNVNRIFFQSENTPVVLSGSAVEDQDVLDFKDRLESHEAFSGVDLPLSNLSNVGNEVLFNLSFTINDLEAL